MASGQPGLMGVKPLREGRTFDFAKKTIKRTTKTQGDRLNKNLDFYLFSFFKNYSSNLQQINHKEKWIKGNN